MDTSYAVLCGIDVGKSEHHAAGLDASGDRLYNTPLPNDEIKLRTVFDNLARYGPVLVIVDQPHTIGALPVTAATTCGHQVAYLPGLSRRRIAD
ncbi:IS110 family transposase, partial [Rhodococcus cerastii]|nr:IS110 family transposase [Rhodococcus cerastii]